MPGYIGRTELNTVGGAISRNAFVGNGAQTSFGPLDQTPFDEEETIVTINGVVQHDASYAVVVDYVNFAVAPDNLDDIEVKVHSTERKPAEGVGPEEVTLANLSTVDIITSNDKFDRALIPSKRLVELAVNDLNASKADYENAFVLMTVTGKTFAISTWNGGGEFVIAAATGQFNLAVAFGMGTIKTVDAVGNTGELTGPITIQANQIVKVRYTANDEAIVELPYIVAGGSAGNSWNLLDTATFSSTPSYNVPIVLGAYERYKLDFINFVPSSNGSHLSMRVRNAGIQDSGNNYRYVMNLTNENALTESILGTGGSSTSEIVLATSLLNTTYKFNGTFYLNDPSDVGNRTEIRGTFSYTNSSGVRFNGRGSGWYTPLSAVSDLLIFMSGGSLASGKMKLYGK